jgi:hypothetical protein
MTIADREPTVTDSRFRTRLIRRWVASHAPPDSTMAYWADAQCNVHRKDEFPGCDIFAVNVHSEGKQLEYYFYAGNWPFPK